MSNRTDFEVLAGELARMFALQPDAQERVATELHNAFVAGQESEHGELVRRVRAAEERARKLGEQVEMVAGEKRRIIAAKDEAIERYFGIVRDLAATSVRWRAADGVTRCWCCGERLNENDHGHAETCPHRRAVEAVKP